MNTQADLIADAVANAAEGIQAFNAKMETIFPVYIARAYPRKILGNNVEIEFANVANRDECSNGILMNASGYMRFLLQLQNGTTTVATTFEINQGIGSWKLREAGLKFRKIKGKTPAEALQKLAAWFEKNADIIKSI